MPSLMINNELYQKIEKRAAADGVSIEKEAAQMLDAAISKTNLHKSTDSLVPNITLSHTQTRAGEDALIRVDEMCKEPDFDTDLQTTDNVDLLRSLDEFKKQVGYQKMDSAMLIREVRDR